MADTKIKGDINKLGDQALNALSKAISAAGIGSAVIHNATDQPVTFKVYNYIDTVYLIAAQQTLVAPHRQGAVAASGAQFKIHPDSKREREFLVTPGKAYVYFGPGDIQEVQPK